MPFIAKHHLQPATLVRLLGYGLRLTLVRLSCPRLRTQGWVRFGSGARFLVRPPGLVTIGHRCEFDRGLTIECEGRLSIGADTFFGHHATVAAKQQVVIGRDCLFAEMVSIRDYDHRFASLAVPVRLQGLVTAPVVIGNNVWLGSKVSVLRGVHIGDNAIVGAGAVVNHDIPANAIAVGVPAKVIRYREAGKE